MLEVRSRSKEQQFQEPKLYFVRIWLVPKNTTLKIKLTERYQSLNNDSTRFRASVALGDVLVRVARRAGIVVIFEEGLEFGNKAGFKLRLRIKGSSLTSKVVLPLPT
jgi:hypothetical protein